VVVLLVAADTASAAPGYRYELNSDETYTPGSTFEFNGSSTGSGITAPFEVTLYGTSRTQLFAHTRGFLQLGGTFGSVRTCLPAANMADPTIFPFWATQGTQSASGSGYGVYTSTDGTAPNRRYIVEWRVFKPATMSSPALDRRFEVILYESSPVITTVYNNTSGVSGADATIGVSAGPAGPHTEYSCGSTSIPGGAYRVDYIPDPRNLSPPAITGTARMGEPLDASTGTWDGTDPITYGYQWLRCDSAATTNCDAIAGADEPSYTPGAADANRRLRVEVKATTMPFPYVYDDTARSAATAIVPPPPGGGGPGPGDPGPGGQDAAPQITSLSVSPRRLTARNRRRGRILYGLSEAATTRLTIQKAAPGRRRGRRCVKPTRRNVRAKRCKRFVPVRPALQHVGGRGANEVSFRAQVGKRRLRAGMYRVVAVATDPSGLSSAPRVAPFRVR
jgi:hypothetical protein